MVDIEQIIEDQERLEDPILTQFPVYCPNHITKTGRKYRSKNVNLLEPTYINVPEGYVDYSCPSCCMKYRIFKWATFGRVKANFSAIQLYLDSSENDRVILMSILKEPIEYRRALVYFAEHPKEWEIIYSLMKKRDEINVQS